MVERNFQSRLIKKLNNIFPNCVILKTDPTYIQGFPDLLILYNDKWAALECKRSADASHQPNQDYYVNRLSGMSYASFICPENEEDVLNDISKALRA